MDSQGYIVELNQAELHAREMEQEDRETLTDYEEFILMKNFENYQMIKLPMIRESIKG